MAKTFSQKLNISIHPHSKAFFTLERNRETTGFACLKQVHGVKGHEAVNLSLEEEGDWLWTSQPGLPIAVKVADCTAILFYGTRSQEEFVAAVHAGWRGTAAGILEHVLETLTPDAGLVAWLSPSICQEHFEVGGEVLEALGGDSKNYSVRKRDQKYLLDLKAFQISKLKKKGVQLISSSLCTYCQPDFYSYRRDIQKSPSDRHFAVIELLT